MDVDRRMYCSLLHTMALLYLSIHKKVRYVVILDLVTIMKVQPDNFQRIHFTVLVVLDQLPDRGMTVIRTRHRINSIQSQTHLAVTVIHKQLIETKMQSERLQRHGCDSHNMIAGTRYDAQ
jgi:inosine-uridine nucleoside N-ribohydrolase